MKETNNDRFSNYEDDVKQLVLDFERTVLRGESQFFDADELECIIDYYLEVDDREPLITAIVYAEQLYPDSVEIRLRRAHWYMVNKKYDRAQELLLKLEEQNPENTDLAYSLGVLYSELKQGEKAIDYFLQAATDGWQLDHIYMNIAEEFYRLHNFDEALVYYRDAIKENSEAVDAMYNYVDTCDQASRSEEAVEFMKAFVKQHPYSKEGWYCLGCAYRNMMLVERAIDAFQYAVAIDKNYEDAMQELAYAQEELGQVGEAATTLNHLLEVTSKRERVYLLLARLFVRHNNADTAMLYLRKALAENEDNIDGQAMYALCLLYQGESHAAISLARKVLAVNDEQPDALQCMAMAYDEMDNVEAANDYFERLMASPQCNEMHCRLYTAFLYGRQLFDTMIDFGVESLEVLPHDAFYSTYLAAAYFYTNRYNRMRQVLADVDAGNLYMLCPEAWQHPRLAPLMPAVPQSNDFDTEQQ